MLVLNNLSSLLAFKNKFHSKRKKKLSHLIRIVCMLCMINVCVFFFLSLSKKNCVELWLIVYFAGRYTKKPARNITYSIVLCLCLLYFSLCKIRHTQASLLLTLTELELNISQNLMLILTLLWLLLLLLYLLVCLNISCDICCSLWFVYFAFLFLSLLNVLFFFAFLTTQE